MITTILSFLSISSAIGKLWYASFYFCVIVGALIALWVACWLLVTFCDAIKVLAKAIFGDIRGIGSRKTRRAVR